MINNQNKYPLTEGNENLSPPAKINYGRTMLKFVLAIIAGFLITLAYLFFH